MSDRERARRILSFREEIAALAAEGVVTGDAVDLPAVRAHHEAMLAAISGREEVDFTREEARLSAGMRIATVLGAAALSAAWGFFVAAAWGELSRGARLAVVVFPPILLVLGTAAAARREASGYVASIVATVATVAFGVNLVAVASLYDLPDSRGFFLVVGLFAMLLAYGYGLALPLLLGIAGLGAWLWSLAAIPQGRWWDGVFGQFEFLVMLGLVAMTVSALVHRGPAHFRSVWRATGVTAVVFGLVFLGLTDDVSLFSGWHDRAVESLYQGLGAVVFVILIWQGLARDRIEYVRGGAVGMTLLLMFRMFDWFWEWIPKWLFFLVVGTIAFGALLLLRRLRCSVRRMS